MTARCHRILPTPLPLCIKMSEGAQPTPVGQERNFLLLRSTVCLKKGRGLTIWGIARSRRDRVMRLYVSQTLSAIIVGV